MNSQTKIRSFEVIPVIDLMGGQVVRAKCGQRHSYQPVQSALCDSSDPAKVAHALLGLYPFDTLYIADLDAILGRGNHRNTVASLQSEFPGVAFWVDAGVASGKNSRPWDGMGVHCILGSESQTDTASAWQLIEDIGPNRAILSLDFSGGEFKGPGGLLHDAAKWPQQVIAMPMSRVGSYAGPDVELLKDVLSRADGRDVYAAGGVRDIADMENLGAMGICGALVASALHDGKLTAQQIAGLGK